MLEWYKIELGEMLDKAKKDLKTKRENKSKAAEAEAEPEAFVDSDAEDEAPKPKTKSKPAPKEDPATEEDLEARVRKIESGLQERQDGMRGGKTLLVEFSIENVQVRPLPKSGVHDQS
jgi:nucleolar protein 4